MSYTCLAGEGLIIGVPVGLCMYAIAWFETWRSVCGHASNPMRVIAMSSTESSCLHKNGTSMWTRRWFRLILCSMQQADIVSFTLQVHYYVMQLESCWSFSGMIDGNPMERTSSSQCWLKIYVCVLHYRIAFMTGQWPFSKMTESGDCNKLSALHLFFSHLVRPRGGERCNSWHTYVTLQGHFSSQCTRQAQKLLGQLS